jgi:hypothetical protein
MTPRDFVREVMDKLSWSIGGYGLLCMAAGIFLGIFLPFVTKETALLIAVVDLLVGGPLYFWGKSSAARVVTEYIKKNQPRE